MKGYARVQLDIENPDGTVERLTLNRVDLNGASALGSSAKVLELPHSGKLTDPIERIAQIHISGELLDVDGVQLTVVKQPLTDEQAWRRYRDERVAAGFPRRQLRKRDFLAGFKAARS